MYFQAVVPAAMPEHSLCPTETHFVVTVDRTFPSGIFSSILSFGFDFPSTSANRRRSRQIRPMHFLSARLQHVAVFNHLVDRHHRTNQMSKPNLRLHFSSRSAENVSHRFRFSRILRRYVDDHQGNESHGIAHHRRTLSSR